MGMIPLRLMPSSSRASRYTPLQCHYDRLAGAEAGALAAPTTLTTDPLRKRRLFLLPLTALLIAAVVICDVYFTPKIDLRRLHDVPSIRVSEAMLPQHDTELPFPEGREGRFVLFLNNLGHYQGFNNQWQEMVVMQDVALRARRAYVFSDIVLEADETWPLGVFMAGPGAGAPWPADVHAPRAVHVEFFRKVCPAAATRRVYTADVGVPPHAEGAEVVDRWSAYLADLPDNCVEVHGAAMLDGDLWFLSNRSLSIWPTLAASPVLTHHAWSPLVHAAVSRNLPLITGTPDNAGDILAGVAALHVRRGDFAMHCDLLADIGAVYAGWNALPQLPDALTPGMTRAQHRRHCWPSLPRLVARLADARAEYEVAHPGAPKLRRAYLLTNSWPRFVRVLADALRRDGWDDVVTSRDLFLVGAENIPNQVVDMEIARRAALFVGNGFSTMTGTIVALRLVLGADVQSIRFW